LGKGKKNNNLSSLPPSMKSQTHLTLGKKRREKNELSSLPLGQTLGKYKRKKKRS